MTCSWMPSCGYHQDCFGQCCSNVSRSSRKSLLILNRTTLAAFSDYFSGTHCNNLKCFLNCGCSIWTYSRFFSGRAQWPSAAPCMSSGWSGRPGEQSRVSSPPPWRRHGYSASFYSFWGRWGRGRQGKWNYPELLPRQKTQHTKSCNTKHVRAKKRNVNPAWSHTRPNSEQLL